MPCTTIPAAEARARLAADTHHACLIDVRSPGEFASVHAEGARLAPLDRLDPTAIMKDLVADPEAEVLLICHSGARASDAAKRFQAAGFDNVVVVEGGTKAWQAAGLPVVTGKHATISVERQMQLTVGTLILVGSALAAFVNQWFLLLPAAIGLGLFNAGATGLCPLAMVIAAMPWNQGGASCPLQPQASDPTA